MKTKIIPLIVILLLVLSTSAVMGAGHIDTKGIISFEPTGFLSGAYNIGYEKPLDNTNSIKGFGSFFYYSAGTESISGFGAGAQYRYYTENEAPEGFYVGPSGSFSSFEGVSLFSVGGVGGYQWIYEDTYTIDGYVGVDYYLGSYDLGSEFDSYSFSGIVPSYGVSFGYKF